MLTRGAMLAVVAVLAAGCMGGVPGPGQTVAPGQTQPGGQVPAGTNTCNLITPAEMSAIWGETLTPLGEGEGACTWSNGMNTRLEETDIATAKQILSNQADVTVAGRPGVIGTLFGLGLVLYVQAGNNLAFVVQTVLVEDNAENRQKVIRTAEAALT